MNEYETVHPSTIEPKTVSATAGAGAAGVLSGFVLYVLSRLLWHGDAVPLPVEQLVLLLVPAAITFVAAYYTRHVNRPTAEPAPPVNGNAGSEVLLGD